MTTDLKIGDSFTGVIRALSNEGWGVVNAPEGRVFFVAGTWPGDEGTFQVLSLKDRYGYAQVISLEKLSTERRQQVPCPHHGFTKSSCGGCPWMLADYSAQLSRKEARLRHDLVRAGFQNVDSCVQPIWGAPSEFNYRNRAQFKTNGVQVGYVASESHTLVPIEKCLVLNDAMTMRLEHLQAQLPCADWVPVAPHRWNFIDLDEDSDCSHVLLNKRRPFRQGNTAQNQRMREWLHHLLKSELSQSVEMLELFAGSGNFTEVLLPFASKLWASEVVEVSVSQLAERFGSKVHSLKCDLFNFASVRILFRELLAQKIEFVFLDPPRDGAKIVCEDLGSLPLLKDIVYVSCDTPTLIRDLKALQKQGFQLLALQPLDLFPQTSHLENLVHLRRQL